MTVSRGGMTQQREVGLGKYSLNDVKRGRRPSLWEDKCTRGESEQGKKRS
jgi:hypothetical protein